MVAVYDEPPTWDWTKNPKQDEFVNDASRFAIWIGGRGSTKTTSSFCRIWNTICDIEARIIRPEWYGAQILVAAPIFRQMKRGPLVKFDEVFDDTGLVQKKVNGNEPRRELPFGITFHFFNVGPHGEGAESWRGSEYAIAYLDEVAQMPEKTFMLANATLRQKRRDRTSYAYQTIMSSTPAGKNWFWRRFLNRDSRRSYKNEDGSPMYPDENVLIIQSSTKESVEAGILEPDYITNLGYIPGTMKYMQEVEGMVVEAAGAVFEQAWKTFAGDKTGLVVYGGLDLGTVDPTAIIVAGIDSAGNIYVLREWYQARARMRDWADTVGEWTQEFGVRKWFVDSDMTVRLMRQAGFQARFPYKANDAADIAVTYINNKILQGAFHIHESCIALMSEMSQYEYSKEFDGDEVTFLQKVAKGQPDHAIDALRYAVLPLSAAKASESYGRQVRFSIG